VQGIVAARLDALPEDEKTLLQDASVLGKVFWLGAAAEIGGVERYVAEEALHRLERKEFVRRERRPSVAGESEYAFGHLLVRDVAYSQVPRARRSGSADRRSTLNYSRTITRTPSSLPGRPASTRLRSRNRPGTRSVKPAIAPMPWVPTRPQEGSMQRLSMPGPRMSRLVRDC
jgi:hypothetical protein